MPMNLDSVGQVSSPGERSWNSNDALLYALGVGAGQTDPTGFELEFTTENSQDVKQQRAADVSGHRRPGRRRRDAELRRHQLGDARARRAARRELRRDPGRRHDRVVDACRRHLRQGLGRARGHGDRVEVQGLRQARVQHAVRRVHPRRGRFREPGRGAAGPAEDPGHEGGSRSHVRDASRPAVAVPPER